MASRKFTFSPKMHKKQRNRTDAKTSKSRRAVVTETQDDDAGEVQTLREFIHMMPIGVLRFASNGVISMLNPAVIRLLSPVIGSAGFANIFVTLATLCPDLQHGIDAFAPRPGHIIDERRINLRMGSRYQILSLTITCVRPDTYMAILKDITARTSVDPKLRLAAPATQGPASTLASWSKTESDELEDLQNFIHLMPIGVCRFTDDGVISMLNPKFRALLMPLIQNAGLGNIYTSLASLCPNLRERIEAFADPVGIIIDQQSLTAMSSAQIVTLSLTVTRVQPGIHMAVLKDISGFRQIQAAVRAADDALTVEIESRRVTELQLIQAQKMETVGQLTGGLAHDFNNLLTVVILNLEILGDRWSSDGESQGVISDAMGAATRGAELTHQLLAFSRPRQLSRQAIDINEVIETFVRLLRRALGTDITIECDLAETVRPVMIDRVQFESAIANLANNARDSMPGGGTIAISTRNTGASPSTTSADAPIAPADWVTITIGDTGTGMPPDVQQRIFEPFFTTKPPGEGTGLGLSMTMGFIRQSGGEISVQSAPSQGTMFTIVLPAVSRTARPATATLPAAPVAAPNGQTILVVDDNDPLRRIVTRCLLSAGYKVLETGDAQAALKIIAGQTQVDILLTDIVMPGGMNGYELAKAAQSYRPGLKTILTTGFDPTSNAPTNAQFSGKLIRKPYRMQDMLRIINEANSARA